MTVPRRPWVPGAAVLALLTAAACGSPPPPPPAPAPVAAPDSAALARAAEASARRWFDEGVMLGRQGRWPEAEQRYRRAAAALASEPTYRFALASALLAQDRVPEAADAFQAGIDIEERAPQPDHTLLAEEYERLIQILTRLGQQDRIAAVRARQQYHRELRDVLPP